MFLNARMSVAALIALLPLQAFADAQSSEVAKLFATFCLSSQPTMVVLQERAKQIEATKQTDKTVPLGANRSLHQATWLVRGPSGIYQIIAMQSDMASGPNQSVGCGVSAPRANGNDLAQTLATEAGLGGPVKRVDASGDNGNSVVWNRQFGTKQARVLLSYGKPNVPGASIHMILSDVPKS